MDDKLTIDEIPQGTTSIVLKPEWQYRINGGFTQVTFRNENDAEWDESDNYEIVEGSGKKYQKYSHNGVLVSKLLKKCFNEEALQYIKDQGIKVFGDDESKELSTEDEEVYAIENSDS